MFGRAAQRDADKENPAELLAAQLAKVELRLSELETQLAELRHISTEWEDWYEKFKTLHARLARREQRDTPPPPVEAPMNPAALALLGRQRTG